MTTHDRDWTKDAACRGLPPEFWFPELPDEERDIPKHKRSTGEMSSFAKRICSHCPVRKECRQYAIDTDSRYGIWGQTTQTQRARITGRSPAGNSVPITLDVDIAL